MVIGAFGDLVFEVSNFKVVTFDDFKRTTKAKFAEHNIILEKAKLEFLYSELEEITFTMIFLNSLGVNPFDEVQKARVMCKTGEANFLIIGNHAYGENAWVITDMTENVTVWNGKGEMIGNKLDVSLREYVS